MNTPHGNKPLSAKLSAWKSRGQMIRAAGHDVFVLTEGPADAPALLVLHGFPTFSYDFAKTLSALTERYRVVLHDHVGFGLSAKPSGYSYSLLEQAEVALAVWQQLGITRGHLLGHDYGTSVATELLARRERVGLPITFDSITLCNGSVHIELAHLTVSQKLMRSPRLGPIFVRLISRGFFRKRFRYLFADPRSISDDELDLLWEGITCDGGRARLPQISSYLFERVRFWNRWIGSLTRLDLPTHVLWGREDPIAVPAIAEQLAAEIPGAKLSLLNTLGHYPMIEDPRKWTHAVRAFLDPLPKT